MGAGNQPKTRKGRERGPRHGGKGHHGKRHDPYPGRAYHDRGTSAAPPPPNAPRLPGTHPPTHTVEASIGRRTDHTSAHPPATRNRTWDGGHTYTGRTGHTHRGSRRERRRKAHHHALTPAATRATSQAPEEDEGTATATRTRDQNPPRTQDQGTGPKGVQPDGPSRDRPTRPTSPSDTPKPPQHGPSGTSTPNGAPQPPASHNPARTPHHDTGQADLN